MIANTPPAPTIEAIDNWLAQADFEDKGDGLRHHVAGTSIYGANIWTKAGSCRCITSKAHWTDGSCGYWTIRGEGSSNGGRETAIPASKIVRAEGWIIA